MSREEIIRRWVQGFNDRDITALLSVTTADFEFRPYLATLIEATTYHGHEGISRYFEDADAAWERIEIRLDAIREAPDNRMFAAGSLEARGRASGLEVRVPVAWAAGFRDDAMAWAHTFQSEAEALEAAGLSA